MLRLFANASPETQYHFQLVLGFWSYLLIPFLGLVSYSKTRLAPAMIVMCVMWFVVGVFAVGGGVTPMGPGDIVTREQREFWFAQPWVQQVIVIWLMGLAIGIPLTVATWLFEHQKLSKPVKTIILLFKFATFPFAVWKFIQLTHR